jgi:group I intron endonuclease
MKREVICGIYKITSPNGRVYVGQSKDIYKRWVHYERLKCEQQKLLYYSLSKYGVKNHIFEIIHVCDKSDLDYLEKKYVLEFNSVEEGLNIRYGGKNGEISEQQKKQISEKLLGHTRTIESRIKQSETIKIKGTWNKGLTGYFSEESLRKIGKRHSEESYEKIAKKLRGVTHSDERKLKNSEAVKKSWDKRKKEGNENCKHTEATKEKLRIANTGKKLSPETIAKILATKKRNRELIEEEKRMMIF